MGNENYSKPGVTTSKETIDVPNAADRGGSEPPYKPPISGAGFSEDEQPKRAEAREKLGSLMKKEITGFSTPKDICGLLREKM